MGHGKGTLAGGVAGSTQAGAPISEEVRQAAGLGSRASVGSALSSPELNAGASGDSDRAGGSAQGSLPEVGTMGLGEAKKKEMQSWATSTEVRR